MGLGVMDFYTITCAIECSGAVWLINQGGVPIGIESIRARSQHRLSPCWSAFVAQITSFFFFFFHSDAADEENSHQTIVCPICPSAAGLRLRFRIECRAGRRGKPKKSLIPTGVLAPRPP